MSHQTEQLLKRPRPDAEDEPAGQGRGLHHETGKKLRKSCISEEFKSAGGGYRNYEREMYAYQFWAKLKVQCNKHTPASAALLKVMTAQWLENEENGEDSGSDDDDSDDSDDSDEDDEEETEEHDTHNCDVFAPSATTSVDMFCVKHFCVNMKCFKCKNSL